jgi:cell division septum initiation protein DivIVA
MMKESTRRKRTRQEMEEVKEFEQSLKADRQQFLQETKRLKQERDVLQDQMIELSQSHEMLQQVYSQRE